MQLSNARVRETKCNAKGSFLHQASNIQGQHGEAILGNGILECQHPPFSSQASRNPLDFETCDTSCNSKLPLLQNVIFVYLCNATFLNNMFLFVGQLCKVL